MRAASSRVVTLAGSVDLLVDGATASPAGTAGGVMAWAGAAREVTRTMP